MDTARPCKDCGGTHRIMETCPAKPGAIELFRMWVEGDRSPLTLLAVFGTTLLLVLVAVGLQAIVS